MKKEIEVFTSGNYELANHFYPKAQNALVHSMVENFFSLNNKRIIERFHHLNPKTPKDSLESILFYKPKFFNWGGSDLFHVTTANGKKQMILIETNSCPSGQKSMPQISQFDEYRGYKNLIEKSFIPLIDHLEEKDGVLAVLWDKNYLEVSGYAQTLSDITGEDVYLIKSLNNEKQNFIVENDFLVFDVGGKKTKIRAALRYVTQKPWNRIPIKSKTIIYNPINICLAGGRNKLMASKAYDLYNTEIAKFGLKISVPQTIRDVNLDEIPLWIEKFGGMAVIKVPYSNAGQGVYTITNPKELEDFMSLSHDYNQFIVQQLVGHHNWSSMFDNQKFYHIGTIPDKKNRKYVCDIRVMVIATPEGFRPCAIYARRAMEPIADELTDSKSSWEMLGTNLSHKIDDNKWDTDTNRLLMIDQKDFNKLGISFDDLVEAYIQTVLSIIAIDKMAEKITNADDGLNIDLFKNLNKDEKLLAEIMD